MNPMLLLRLSALGVTALAPGCGGGDGLTQQAEPVSSVTVTAPKTEIRVGQTVQLTATALDADGNVLQDRSFEWTSGIGSVASVSPTGLVTGVNKGQSKIRATTDRVTGSLEITVDPRASP